jgi:PST family polysaccharide transporter
MRRYGLSVAASNWVFRLRTLVNPIIIGYFLGPEGVGYVALAIRIVEVLSFVKKATWQLSVAAFARIQGDLPRLSRAFQEAMGLQMLGLGPFFAGFALVSLWLIPLLYGERWMPVLTVLPFIALGYMFNAVFNMHSSVLYVMRRNRDVVAFSSLHVALFAGAAVLLVDRLGLVGYGLAEVVALGSYIIIHRRMARVFDFDYVKVRPWLLASAPPLFFPFLGFPWGILLCVPAVAALAFDRSAHAQLREYASYAMRNYGRRFRKKGTTSRNLGREADESQANA